MLNFATFAKPLLIAAAILAPTAALAADRPGLKGDGAAPGPRAVPSVPLRSIAKEVDHGVFELDPSAAQGKHIILPSGLADWVICIGKWDHGVCKGIYIGTPPLIDNKN